MQDNARKFLTESLDPSFLMQHNVVSFSLVVDWLETNEDNEKKIVYKKFENGEVQIFLVTKITTNGNRISDKKKITKEEYVELLKSSILTLEKMRYEFDFIQNGITFFLKYDDYKESNLEILEVDAETEEERDKFDPEAFEYKLSEVTADLRYGGYRVKEML